MSIAESSTSGSQKPFFKDKEDKYSYSSNQDSERCD